MRIVFDEVFMKVGLIGFSFSHENKGCEALTYSILEMLKEVLRDTNVEIVNFSSCKELGDILLYFPKFKFKSYEIKLKDLGFDYIKELNSCDVVFDITFGDGFSDIYFTKPMYKNILIKWIAGCCKTKFVLAPQTYGPFSDKKLEKIAAMAIKKADYVFSRDQLSTEYVKKISKRNIITVTDLAFALPYDKSNKQILGNNIGINISGLLWKGGFTSNNQFGLVVNYKEYCEKLVDYLLKNTDYTIHLISHVTYSCDKNKKVIDSDIEACQAFKSQYKSEKRVVIAEAYSNPIEIKNYISKMNYFLGARMHATIGAFSSGVKTIPFAYSRKFQGLYENIGYSFYIDGTKMSTEQALETTISYIDNPEKLEIASKKAMKNIEENLQLFYQELKRIAGKALDEK